MGRIIIELNNTVTSVVKEQFAFEINHATTKSREGNKILNARKLTNSELGFRPALFFPQTNVMLHHSPITKGSWIYSSRGLYR